MELEIFSEYIYELLMSIYFLLNDAYNFPENHHQETIFSKLVLPVIIF